MSSRDKTTVSVFLKTGIRLTGKIESFDRYTVELASPRGSQSIMKHAIATVLPGGGGTACSRRIRQAGNHRAPTESASDSLVAE
ncbi:MULTISPECIES: RNA chaperone Hfq [Paraburkholderia]|uniref:RNA chaperone Hfq n=1 Tax=Paraburkholderia TaxID=1822464 RepID=UPI000A019D88|nr:MULTISPECIES: RNA chaperone Hfq [Paraburkholderia]MDH6149486.1 host factor-I protein [Paraburkholderia sp. WSM4179]